MGVQRDFLMVMFYLYTVLKGSRWQHLTTDRALRGSKYDERTLDLL